MRSALHFCLDRMESSYRTWLRARREGLKPEDLDELSRELQMALGTAKWQVRASLCVVFSFLLLFSVVRNPFSL